jgi:predicted  nucleic acid-binding Zn-ribbon protein
VVTAAMQDQWRLLEVQEHDSRLDQIAHRRRTLPELAEIVELEKRLAEVDADLVVARTAERDLARDVAKAEADVEQVRSRAARNQARLDSGQGAAKELQNMQHELETLAARQSVLEDAELEIMERQEQAVAALAAVEAAATSTQEQLAVVRQRRDARFAELDAEQAELEARRKVAADGLPPALLELYVKVRDQNHGLGAARLYQRRCEGCRMELPPNDLARIKNAPADEVVRCEECRRILVRTADSGI